MDYFGQELFSSRSRLNPLLFSFALTFAGISLFLWLNSIPGLHGDEAWVGLRAHDILNGSRPILGMTDYTGPIHQYLSALFLKVFGLRVWALRLFGAISSLFCIFLYERCVREFFDRETAAISALVLALIPFFTLFGRIANEVFALHPLLALGAIYLALTAPKSRNGWAFHALSGFCLGLGIWTHLIFLSFTAAFAFTALFRMRRAFFATPPAYLTSLGAIVALFPRLVYQYAVPHGPGFAIPLAQKLREWPGEFFSLLHGDVMFRRYTGTVLFPSPNLSVFFFVFGALILLLRLLYRQDRRAEASFLVFFATLTGATLWISPANSDRYFLLPLFCAPVLIATGLEGFFSLLQSLGTRGVRPIAVAGAFALALLQVTRMGVNYFHSFHSSGGRLAQFFAGGFSETSNHYVDFSALHEKLLSLGAKQVCSEFLLSTSLEFYSINDGYRNSWQEQVCKDLAKANATGVYAVVFAADPRALRPSDFPGFDPVFSDSHFSILKPK